MKKEEFLTQYNLLDRDLAEANLEWSELELILNEYEKLDETLHVLGKEFIDEYLYDIEKAGIHSYRYRTKSAGHLLEKIIRKRKESPNRFDKLDHTNFHKFITDLIGIRVFFLYREDWIHFHQYITKRFENNPELYIDDRLGDFDEDVNHYYIAEKPKVFKRSGDTKIYDDREIDIISSGIYRSLHYVIKYKGYYVEIQCRTLFEEGWSEIDHDIVYPYNQDDAMLKDFSTLLNRLSGMADEMSSYFRRMKEEREK
ncbi:MAG: GTP pyrophosphokinase [Lachnospiraceae bacterium]|nr:GTP pyrophosphokinase [Lachnospiraceae bacterium]